MTDRRILVYGDSNTYGTVPMAELSDKRALGKGERWGDVLAAHLGAGWDVVIEGLPGRTTVLDDPIEGAYRNGLTVLPAILHSHAPIDHLVICLGTNDQKYRFNVLAEDIGLGVGRLVREALVSGTVGSVLAVSPPPVKCRGSLAAMFQGADVRNKGLAAQIERFARAEGAAFFDAGSVIDVNDLDGVHWSTDAHETLGAALADVVRALD